jgi:hypothetical protein
MAAAGSQAAILGPNDFHAGYMSFMAPVKKGDRLKVKAQFPHCRYLSFTVYDQDLMIADSLSDYSLVPSRGANPFLAGADRSGKELGEYELQVLMEDPPAKAQRQPNTLYAGRAESGKPNRTMILAYRVYLPDKGYGFEDGHPLAVYGGVEPGLVQLYDPAGQPVCPSESERRPRLLGMAARALKKNLKTLLRPEAALGKAQDPPVWINNASRENQRESTIVPNEETAYIMAPISSELGELLVLRWKAARTPEETYTGKPFPADYDLRYWSLSFAAFNKSEGLGIVTEKTAADVETPKLPDGTRQLVIGLNGRERPAAVPAEMWVGLKLKKGLIIMRNIQIRPGYAGDFGLMPAGPIRGELDRWTPGGVYCSVAEFEQNPEIGLRRQARMVGNY